MVKIISDTKYVCEICHRIHPTALEARNCQLDHDLVYVPFQRADLKRLVAFINLGEQQLLTRSLLDTLNHYASISSEPEPDRNRNRPKIGVD